jgi:hypothetical protein
MYKQIGKLSGILSGTVVALCVMTPAVAQDNEPAVKEYDTDGESCIDLRSVRRTEIIDDRNILFHMRGKTVYHNILPHQCGGLARENRFSYTTSIGRLCSLDMIHVLYTDPFGLREGNACSLGKFHEISREDAEAMKETQINEPVANPLPMPEPEEVGVDEEDPEVPE